MNLKRKVKVTNRTSGMLGYTIDVLRVSRFWNKPGDYLNIAIDELLELKTVPGGMNILTNWVVIEDEEALKIVFDDQEVQPEYKYGLEEVDFLLYEATLEQLLDALDYAPEGVLNLILSNSKKKLPNTTAKISAINDKFNTNINQAFELNQGGLEDSEEAKEDVRPRRTAPIDLNEKEADIPKYNVVKKR